MGRPGRERVGSVDPNAWPLVTYFTWPQTLWCGVSNCVAVCVCYVQRERQKRREREGGEKPVAKVLKLNGIYLPWLLAESGSGSRHQFKLNFHLPRLVCSTAGQQFVP